MDALPIKASVLPSTDLVSGKLPEPGGDKASAKEAAKQFEGLLMSMLFQNLRKTVQPSGLFGEDTQSRSTYEYLLDQAVVEHSLNSGQGWGLAERLENAWSAKTGGNARKSSPGT